MKYKDLEDCDECPFYKDLCKGGWTSSPSGTPIEPPCTCWEDDDDLDALYDEAIESMRRHELAEEKRWLKEQEEKKKKEEKAKKVQQTRWAVRAEQREIVQLRRKIRNNKKLLSLAQGFAAATNFANEMFGYEERLEIKKKNPLERENEKLQARIDELIKTKKEKLKQIRIQRKKESEVEHDG